MRLLNQHKGLKNRRRSVQRPYPKRHFRFPEPEYEEFLFFTSAGQVAHWSNFQNTCSRHHRCAHARRGQVQETFLPPHNSDVHTVRLRPPSIPGRLRLPELSAPERRSMRNCPAAGTMTVNQYSSDCYRSSLKNGCSPVGTEVSFPTAQPGSHRVRQREHPDNIPLLNSRFRSA